MPPAAPLPRWRVFPPLALGTLMAVLDISVVGLVLPVLARSLGAPLSTVTWVVLAYVLAVTGLLLAFGRLADRIGRRRVYAAGLLTFVIASMLCALSPTAGWLIAARALQGVGAAMMSANSAALLVAAFPPEERGRALGAFGAVVGAGLALGPPLGGLLVGALSWHWLFLVNLPLGVLTFVLMRAHVPADPAIASDAPAGTGAALAWCAGLGGATVAR
jgi:multidrug resistance protein